jgi:hypothetical protein
MWFLLMSRVRTWLLLTVVVPLATGLLRRAARALERRTGSTQVTRALYKAGDLGDRARATLRGGRRRRRR